MWNLKFNTNEPIYETETKSETQKTNGGCQGGGEQERGGLGIQGQQMQSGIYRMDKRQDSTVQQRERYSIAYDNHNGKKYEKE